MKSVSQGGGNSDGRSDRRERSSVKRTASEMEEFLLKRNSEMKPLE